MQVLNVRDLPAEWKSDPQYISLMSREDGWCNPYVVGIDGGRDECLSLYLAWIQMQIKGNTSFAARLYGLKDKVLVCKCTPAPCHGQFLCTLVEGLVDYETKRTKEKAREFHDITVLGDMNRQAYLHQLVHQIIIKHGCRCMGHLRQMVEEAVSRGELSGREMETETMSTWKQFRLKYLTPLLRWNMPPYREPITEGA